MTKRKRREGGPLLASCWQNGDTEGMESCYLKRDEKKITTSIQTYSFFFLISTIFPARSSHSLKTKRRSVVTDKVGEKCRTKDNNECLVVHDGEIGVLKGKEVRK